MPYKDTSVVNINLQTASATQAGFGTQMFIGTHAWFRERSRSYSSLTAAASDMPTTSDEYKALSAAFAQPIKPTAVKVGRREAVTTITPDDAVNGKIYSVTVEVNNGASVAASYTATVPTDTQEDICTALKNAIDADANVVARVTTAVVGTGAAAVLTITQVSSTDEYAVSSLAGVTATFTTSENAATCLANIKAQDDDFFFVTSNDHTEAFVLAMAAAIEVEKKMYFVSSKDEAVLGTLAQPATDIFGKLTDLNYLNTATFYSQDADKSFPECAFVARWSTSTPGTVAWFSKTLAGVANATALNGGTTAVPISGTQKDNLVARNANFTEDNRGVSVVYGGKVAGDEWIDIIRSKFYIKDRTEVAIANLFLNSPKVTYDDAGTAGLESVCTSTWNRFISASGRPNILDAAQPYITDFPAAADVSSADKAARYYAASATLYLAGAIRNAELTINLTYQA